MKNLPFLLIGLISFTGLSQDIRLFEQTWILHNLILEGQSYIPPINSEQNHVPADFIEPHEIYTGVCSGTSGLGFVEYNGTTEFSLPQGIIWLAGSCILQENNAYAFLYNSFWNQSPLDTFQYEISDTQQERTLIVTASNGDQAIYSNNYLSTSKFKIEDLLIYPNPTSDILNLIHTENIAISRIRIYDFQGREVIDMPKNVSHLNVESLKPGIYFISIENNKNEISNRKFVKR